MMLLMSNKSEGIRNINQISENICIQLQSSIEVINGKKTLEEIGVKKYSSNLFYSF